MKKFFATFLALIAALTLSVCLTACADKPDSTETRPEGEWKIYQLISLNEKGQQDKVYTVGNVYPEFEELGDFATSYKIILYENGTATYVEEWQEMKNCQWTRDGNNITIDHIGENNGVLSLVFENDTLTSNGEFGIMIFKK